MRSSSCWRSPRRLCCASFSAASGQQVPGIVDYAPEFPHAGGEGNAGVWLLALVIGAEALGTGLGTAAFVSFIARETNPAYTATQFALLTSFSAVPRTFCNAATGFLVEGLGWENFFILCTLLAIPGMLLLFKVAPWNGKGSVFE